MGLRGPQKQFPQQVWVNLSDEQYDSLKRESALLNLTMSDVIREAIAERINSGSTAVAS
jgi:predicted DNA-binding protein